MQIGSLNNSTLYSTLKIGATNAPADFTNGVATGGTAGSNEAHGHHHGHGGMMKEVMQTLSQLGLDPQSAQAAQSGNSAASATAGATSSTSANLSQFTADLVQALQASGPGSSTAGAWSGVVSGYQNVENSLHSLIANLNTAAGSTSPSLNQLQSDFQNLVTSMDGAGGTASAGSAAGAQGPTLQAFLSTLMQNIASGASSNSALTSSLSATA